MSTFESLSAASPMFGDLDLDPKMQPINFMSIINCQQVATVQIDRHEDDLLSDVIIVPTFEAAERLMIETSNFEVNYNPSPRRTSMGIIYECEQGGGLYWLVSVQHKGVETIFLEPLDRVINDLFVGMIRSPNTNKETMQ